jgi:amino acid adenylation domain-containing protein
MMSMTETKRMIFDSKLMGEKEYWLNQLSARRDLASLKTDFARPAAYTNVKQSIEISVPEELSQRVTKAANNSDFLLYTLLMAALKICLLRYTGGRSIIVGSPAISHKANTSETNNAVAILDEISSYDSFRDVLNKVRATLSEAYSRQNYPFTRLIRDLGLEQVDNKNPLFDVMLALEEIHHHLPEMKNDLTIIFKRLPEGLRAKAVYESSLFRQETIERLVQHILVLLRNALENVDEKVGNLEILIERERKQLLVDWNETQADFPQQTCIHHLFEAQVEATPDAIALVCEEQHLTYAELNARANQLAHYLQDKRIGPEALVGIHLHRSALMLIGLLGILKAGGAYVPMDPALPKERLSFMLRDTGAQIVLTEQALASELPAETPKAICLDSKWKEIERYSSDNPQSTVKANNLAYVIYTSGSTGQPKGVMIEHRGVCNMALAQVKAFEIKPETRLLQFASLSFDASVSEIFTALITGATLCIEKREVFYAGNTMRALRDLDVTTITLPPVVLSHAAIADSQGLKTLITAGESCSAAIVERWSPGRRFINAYGPTEVTVCASLWVCQENWTGVPPIGRPLANTQIYLLNRQQSPVPVGVQGELYLSGVGLARGYLNRPELTALKFVPNPFSNGAGTRMYSTGDVALYWSDGNIEFHGRLDNQIKIRGYRIELGEIEGALKQHSAVREAVVMDMENDSGEKYLIGFVVGLPASMPSASDLRVFLKERLPEYMLPSRFEFPDELPLTNNGKVDRRKLAELQTNTARNTNIYEAPRTPAEKTLAEIWATVLGIEKVGRRDNFFELGGHSLLVAQIISRVAEVFNVELPIRFLFESPTLADMSVAILKSQAEQFESESIDDILHELDQLSDEEAEALLAQGNI